MSWDDEFIERVRHALPHAGEPGAAMPAIAPGLAPGGIVFQTWAAGRKLAEDRITGPDIERAAAKAESSAQLALVALADGHEAELRIYDGDSGGWIASRLMLPG